MKKMWDNRFPERGDLVLITLNSGHKVIGFYRGCIDNNEYRLTPSSYVADPNQFFVIKKNIERAEVLKRTSEVKRK